MKSEIRDLRQIISRIHIDKIDDNQNTDTNNKEINKDFEINLADNNEIDANSSEYSNEKKFLIETIYDGKLKFTTELNNYYVLGSLSHDLSTIQTTLLIEECSSRRKERTKIDLYEREQVRYLSMQLAESFFQQQEQIETDLLQLTDELERYREEQIQQLKFGYLKKRNFQLLSPEKEREAIAILKSQDLMTYFDKLIEKSGIVGEEIIRKILFLVAVSYKTKQPLHLLIHGNSGSGKSQLINTMAQCFPPEDVLFINRATSKSFYYFTKNELVDKLIIIQDYEGFDEDAKFAFKELQNSGFLNSSTILKDQFGNISSIMKTANAHFASLTGCSNTNDLKNNIGNLINVNIDESPQQTEKIIEYRNKILSGEIDILEERRAKELLQNCIRSLKTYEVINPFANKIKLPVEAKQQRYLHQQFQAFVEQITLLHQFQRKKDEQNRLIVDPEDLKLACNILFNSIMIKIDDLDAPLRLFFDKLKEWVKTKNQENIIDFQFTQREIRLELNISKTNCFRYFESLEKLEYIQKIGGFANKGFTFKISYWDDMEKIRKKIRKYFSAQLSRINSPVICKTEKNRATIKSKFLKKHFKTRIKS